ncbi:hypothetical protein BH20ACT14_BH20ACT14_11950 [soil metagenome]
MVDEGRHPQFARTVLHANNAMVAFQRQLREEALEAAAA